MQNVLIVIHVIISIILVAIVLMQHGKQQGLSGSIAGGAETFFGKNKGRTIDAMLRKFTTVIATLFIISSVALAFVSVSEHKADLKAAEEAAQQAAESGESADAGEQMALTPDENGNLVDANGSIVITAEQLKEAEAQSAEGENAEAEVEAETSDAE